MLLILCVSIGSDISLFRGGGDWILRGLVADLDQVRSAVGSLRLGGRRSSGRGGASGGAGDLLAEDDVPLVLAGVLRGGGEVGGWDVAAPQGHCGCHSDIVFWR